MKLENRTILITGGSAGIGYAFAQEFLKRGNTVLITGRSADKLAAAKAAHPELHTMQCDASDPEALGALKARIDDEFPSLDTVFNNAGILVLRNVSRSTDDLEELTREIDVNLTGAIRTASLFMDRLVANGGTLINVSSSLAFVPMPCAPIYCATKAALHSYSISLRQQLAGKVEVIELMPPAIETEMMDELSAGADFPMLTLDQLLDATMSALARGKEQIHPGPGTQLYWMSRIAPGFIQSAMAKATAELVPA